MLLTDQIRPDLDPDLLRSNADYRRLVTKYDPLLFAAIYLPGTLREQGSDKPPTLNQFHLDILDYALSWTKNLDIKNKRHDAFIAPRQCGKSTWIFHILPIWAGAHLHKEYIIAFSDSDTQAKGWLQNFKTALGTNDLLRNDYPGLCEPYRLPQSIRAMEDNRNVTMRENKFVFQVAGADSNVLGANRDNRRPQVLLFDDIEPTESNYSAHEAKKRLNTLLSAHFYLNTAAIKVFVGTTTMPDSIMDQIRKVGELVTTYGESAKDYVEQDQKWVLDNNIRCHYYPAIVTHDDGSEESLWPEKWSMDYLNENRHTRDFQMNMMNRPVGMGEGYWSDDDIVIDEPESYGNTIISVDPAVTTKRASDYTGIAVLSRGSDGRIYVRHAEGVRYTSETLREHVETLIPKYNAKVVYVETNQGGDLWKQVFAGIPAKFRSIRQQEKKEVRAAQAHDYYKKGYVRHTRNFPQLEEQLLAFPRVPHDDILDAVVSGVLYFNKRGGTSRARTTTYMEV